MAFFIFAVNSLANKLLLKRPIPEPIVYSFFVGFLSIGALILIPFGFTLNTSVNIIGASIVSGALFFLYLLIFFKILFKEEASRVIPASGALIGIFTFILSRVFLKEQLYPAQILAFLLLILGGVLITVKFKFKTNANGQNLKSDSPVPVKRQYGIDFLKIFSLLCLSSLIFAASFVILKHVFSKTSFINAFVWSRMGIFLASISLLAVKRFRSLIFQKNKTLASSAKLLVAGNKALAGVGSLLMNFAISKGSVTLISALSGIQNAFVFILSIVIFFINPEILKEEVGAKVIIQKIASVLIIAAGLTLLVI